MNRLPEVKNFIRQDLPLFVDAEFKSKPGASPVLKFLSEDGEVIETIELDKLGREDCNGLLESRGFYKRASEDEEISEEKRQNLRYFLREEL